MNNTIKNIYCAGIVLYNPDLDRLKMNIDYIYSQVNDIILVDNGSENIEQILNLWGNDKKISFINNKKNFGISKALNQICEWANVRKYNWVLTLDQDSVCPKNIIEEFDKYTSLENVAIICPTVNYEGVKNQNKTEPLTQFVATCITSASLTSIKAWKALNGFNEWLFIDYVDFDFCMRLRIKGYKILKINDVVLEQQLGNLKIHKFLGIVKIKTYNHSSFRNYYFVRNSIYYIRKYRKFIRSHVEILRLLRWELIKLMFESNKRSILTSIFRGVIDGLNAELEINNSDCR